ncbi:MAG: hypothetical protein K1060chlam2_01387 [Chlamydiae bacterium]|nr:hypothetical protein [Chlamydiota bacterium]
MFIQTIRTLGLFLLLMVVITGCIRVDTDPNPAFSEVQEEVAELTGESVYWDASFEDAVVPISAMELLQNELTDDFVVQIALLNNRTLQAVYENLGIAKAQLAQAGLLKNPIFSFSYRFSTQSIITDLIDTSLFQNFLEILLIPLKKRMARAELEATKAMVITEILDVIAETKIAFYRVQAATQILRLKEQILLAAELSYEAAKRLFAVGNITDLELFLERSLYEQEKLTVASMEIELLEAREKLNLLMGLWGRQIEWKVAATFRRIQPEGDQFKTIENDAIASSIDLKVAYKELLATAAGLGIDTTKIVFPQFDVGVSAERDDSVWFVGPAFSLAIPLFDFGQANSAKAQAKIMQEWNRFTALAIEIRSKARSSRFKLLQAFRESRYLERVIVPLAEQITHSTLLQNHAMQIGIFQLLAAKQNELEKKIQTVHSQQDYWISKVILQTLLQGHVIGKQPFKTPLRRHYE